MEELYTAPQGISTPQGFHKYWIYYHRTDHCKVSDLIVQEIVDDFFTNRQCEPNFGPPDTFCISFDCSDLKGREKSGTNG